jgi:hypothetical protein
MSHFTPEKKILPRDAIRIEPRRLDNFRNFTGQRRRPSLIRVDDEYPVRSSALDGEVPLQPYGYEVIPQDRCTPGLGNTASVVG